jgi:excisionase family DNA binding protein
MDKSKRRRVIADNGSAAWWWNVRQAARYLGMSEAFIRKFVRLRQIPFIRVGTKSVRFSKAHLDEWLQGGPK